MPHVITVLAPGFEETEAVTPIDLLRRAKIDVTILGLESLQVRGSHNIAIAADKLFSAFTGPFDAIMLPGGMPGSKNLAASPALLDLVRETHRRKALCAAICAAPMVLGKAGILRGFQATCYPGNENDLTGAIILEKPVVRDRNVITSRGAGTAIPFALEIITYLTDAKTAEQVKSAILF